MMTIATLPLCFRLAAASLLMLSASACGSAPPAAAPSAAATPTTPHPPTTPVASKTEDLWRKIQAANADNSCDNHSQCHTIGLGSKACGGPERYLAWSSKNADGAALKALIAEHAAARRADDEREHMMSTCSTVPDPGASCRAGQCVINPANPFGGQPNQQ